MNLKFINKRIDIFSLFFFIGVWVFTFLNYASLPENIAIHFDASGKADRFENKTNIFNLPIISALFYIGLIYLNNRVKVIFTKNKTKSKFTYGKYKSVSKTISATNLSFVVFFGILLIRKIQIINDTDELGVWFLAFSFGILFIPIVYALIKLIKN